MTNSSIIFVQLGEKAPLSLFPALKQARFLNPQCDIYLLSDAATEYTDTIFASERTFLIETQSIPLTQEHLQFQQINPLKGFWSHTLERFFYIFDFMSYRNLHNCYHLENDTLIYIDLELLTPIWNKENVALAAPFQSQVACIPCFVFIKDAAGLQPLLAHITSEVNHYKGLFPQLGLNDMRVLASYYHKFGPACMTALPTLMPEYCYSHAKRKSRHLPDNSTPLQFLAQNADRFFPYIFDAATLGIYANGYERGLFAITSMGAVHDRSLFDPRYFQLYWTTNEKDQPVPSLQYKGKSYRLVNLHLHSKLAEEFTSYATTRAEFPEMVLP